MSHDRKHKPRYLGPYEVFKRTIKGNYRLKELDGTPLNYTYAAFRVLPYISHYHTFMRDLTENSKSSEEEANNTDSDSDSD
jgi:hypothetical protein